MPIDILTRRGKPIHECVRPDDGSWDNKYANKPVTPPTPDKYFLVHAQSLPSCIRLDHRALFRADEQPMPDGHYGEITHTP